MALKRITPTGGTKPQERAPAQSAGVEGAKSGDATSQDAHLSASQTANTGQNGSAENEVKKESHVDLTQDQPVDDEFERALKEPNTTSVTEKDLDEIDEAENAAKKLEADDRPEAKTENPPVSLKAPNREQRDLTAARIRAKADAVGDVSVIDFIDSRDKIMKLVDILPADSEDDHVFYGYGGVRLTFGDLRNISKYI